MRHSHAQIYVRLVNEAEEKHRHNFFLNFPDTKETLHTSHNRFISAPIDQVAMC